MSTDAQISSRRNRTLDLFHAAAVVVLLGLLAGCGTVAGLGAGLSAGAASEPPDWFLRDDEKARLAALRRARAPDVAHFPVATTHDPKAFRTRLEARMTRCWVGDDPDWRVDRSGAAVTLSRQTPEDDAPALTLNVRKDPAAPGLRVTATGPLAAAAHRRRLRAALEKVAAEGDPAACPSPARGAS